MFWLLSKFIKPFLLILMFTMIIDYLKFDMNGAEIDSFWFQVQMWIDEITQVIGG